MFATVGQRNKKRRKFNPSYRFGRVVFSELSWKLIFLILEKVSGLNRGYRGGAGGDTRAYDIFASV